MTAHERIPKNVVDHVFSGPYRVEVWNGHCEWLVKGRVDLQRLRGAVTATICEHPMLGVRDGGDGTWVLGAAPARVDVGVCEAGSRDALADRLGRLVSRPFDLRRESPVRFDVVRAPERDHVVAVADHAVVDGVGIGRTMVSLVESYVSSRAAPVDEAWRAAQRLEVAASSEERVADVEQRWWERAMPPAVRLAREHASAEEGQGVAYHGLSSAAVDALGAAQRAGTGTRNDVVVAAFCVAAMSWNRDRGAAVVPFSVSVPVNLRPPRSWLAGVCNATLPWVVRIDDDDPAAVLPKVVEQLRLVRTGIYSPAIQATIGFVAGRRRSLPLRVRHALATTTVVSTVPGTDVALADPQLAAVASGLRGGAPTPGSMGMTFTVVPASGDWQLSARFLRSRHTAKGARRFLSLVDDAVVRISREASARRTVA